MNDFEVHEIGTLKEIQLARELAREIDSCLEQYGAVIPQNVLRVYHKLKAHYAKQIENEVL